MGQDENINNTFFDLYIEEFHLNSTFCIILYRFGLHFLLFSVDFARSGTRVEVFQNDFLFLGGAKENHLKFKRSVILQAGSLTYLRGINIPQI